MGSIAKHLYLCGGLEESGATLVSWCFWQRSELRPVVASTGDLLPHLEPAADGRATWLLTPFRSFRLTEMIHHYRDLGWTVRGLMVVRDLRPVWASLASRTDVRNGVTAEDPPLRVRFRRFVEDWELFWWMRWPMIRIEDLLADAEKTLRGASAALELPYHEVMSRWPRPLEMSDTTRLPDADFCRLRGRNLAETLMNFAGEPIQQTVASADLAWLETEFQEFNTENSYPLVLRPLQLWSDLLPAKTASWSDSRRFQQQRRQPLRWLLDRLGIAQSNTAGAQPVKRAA